MYIDLLQISKRMPLHVTWYNVHVEVRRPTVVLKMYTYKVDLPEQNYTCKWSAARRLTALLTTQLVVDLLQLYRY